MGLVVTVFPSDYLISWPQNFCRFDSLDAAPGSMICAGSRTSCFDSAYPVSAITETMLYLLRKELQPMTQMEVAYRYGNPPREAEMRALDSVREVYGVRRQDV